MPRLLMVGDLLRGKLRVVPLPIPAPDRPVGLIPLRGRALSGAGQAFAGCLRVYVAEIADCDISAPITNGDSEGEKSDKTDRVARG